MNFLLKIVEGPMRGAEIALVTGTRVKVGSSDSCDIVLADASLGATAFELDVAESSVTMITPDGAQRSLDQFEVCDFGTTAVAIGPADEPWGELKRPAKKPEPSAPVEGEPAESPAPEGDSESPAPTPSEKAPEEEGKKRGGCVGCLVSIVVLLAVLAAAAWLLWRYWPPARGYVEEILGQFGEQGQTAVEQFQESEKMSLSDIASQHGLELADDGGRPLLKGNLKRRTERLAIRALATAADPQCKFDVTDDETLLVNSQELLFAYTEGAIKAVAASNRVVELAGFAPSPSALERAIRALDADVKGIERLDTTHVSVGGVAPAAVAESAFVREVDPEPTGVAKTAKPKGSGRADYPIAGILTLPYPCVVMRGGHRVMEGAQIGTATLEKIEADRLILSEGGKSFEWRP